MRAASRCRRSPRAGFRAALLGPLGLALSLARAAPGTAAGEGGPRPVTRPATLDIVPNARWDRRPDGEQWSRAVLQALRDHGAALVHGTPRDISTWCPGYGRAPDASRRAFWVGFLSALAKHESTWREGAVGGGGRWYGLLQILPSTARSYGCRARSGSALKDGAANLSCAVRIMARTVTRDGVIHARAPRWSGVSADWGPMRSAAKRSEMARWLRGQDYCAIQASPRPAARPIPEGLVSGPRVAEMRPPARPGAVTRRDTLDLYRPRRPDHPAYRIGP